MIYGQRTGAFGSYRYFLTQIIDPTGQKATLAYDGQNRLIAITDALGQVTTLAYTLASDSLKITKVTDPFGRFATFAYDASNRLISVTDVLGLVSQYTYQDTSDFISALTTPYGTSTFAFGESAGSTGNAGRNRWLEMTDPQGDKERIECRDDWAGLPGSGALPTGMSVTGSYQNYRNTLYWDKKAMRDHPYDTSVARITHWLHTQINNTSGVIENEKKPFEGRVFYNYEGQGLSYYEGTASNRTAVGRVLDDGTSQVTHYQYNAYGKVTQMTDPVGRITTYLYDPTGIDLLEVHQQVNASGAYEVLGKMTYNTLHLPLTTTDAAGQVTTYTYNTAGQVLTVTNPKNETTTFVYDASGYLKSVTAPVTGAVTQFAYDGFGRLRTVTDSEGYAVTTDYDAMNRPTVVTYPDATYQQMVYDRLDLIKSIDRRGRKTQMRYNAIRQLMVTVDPLLQVTQYDWCKCGAMKSLVDPAGNVTTWNHDSQGRLTGKNFPDGTSVLYNYETTTSRIKSVTDTMGQATNYAYNVDNTLQQVSYTNAVNATPSVSYTYDPFYPRVLTMTDGVGTSTYSYNAIPVTPILGAGRLASIAGPLPNATLTYTYDVLGRVLSSAINGSANTSSVVYDALGRVTTSTNPLGTFTYGYVNQTGRLDHVNYPNGQVTRYSYYPNIGTPGNDDQRLQQIQNFAPGGANLSTFGYTYDAEGTIQTWSKQNDASAAYTSTFGYDTTDQLTSAAVNSSAGTKNYIYRYDKAGNRTSEQIDSSVSAATVNRLNQATAFSPTGPIRIAGVLNKPVSSVTVNGQSATLDSTFKAFSADVTLSPGTTTASVVATDPNGNTSTKKYQVTVANGTARTLVYDFNGNLNNNGAGQTYGWDAANRLITITQSSGVTGFVYDGAGRRTQETFNGAVIKQWVWCGGAQPREERDALNNVTKRFYGASEQIGGASYYFTMDHLGSVREMTDTTGAIRARYDYDPYGRITKLSGDLESDFGFTGFYRHQASGLSLTICRAYDSNLGRWLSRDPIGEAGGINLYGYCGNNPTNWVDPFGLAFLADRPLISTGAKVGAFLTGKDPVHTTIFFEDGKSPRNLSFGSDGITEESAGKGPMYGPRWPVAPAKLDDAIMREAIENLKKSGQWETKDYSRKKTCQEFADAALNEYQNLFNAKKK